jgi:hypothetical protein
MMSEQGTVRPSTDEADETVIPASTAKPVNTKAAEKRIVTKSYTGSISSVPSPFKARDETNGQPQSPRRWLRRCRVADHHVDLVRLSTEG